MRANSCEERGRHRRAHIHRSNSFVPDGPSVFLDDEPTQRRPSRRAARPDEVTEGVSRRRFIALVGAAAILIAGAAGHAIWGGLAAPTKNQIWYRTDDYVGRVPGTVQTFWVWVPRPEMPRWIFWPGRR